MRRESSDSEPGTRVLATRQIMGALAKMDSPMKVADMTLDEVSTLKKRKERRYLPKILQGADFRKAEAFLTVPRDTGVPGLKHLPDLPNLKLRRVSRERIELRERLVSALGELRQVLVEINGLESFGYD